jgi:hypothetical protein
VDDFGRDLGCLLYWLFGAALFFAVAAGTLGGLILVGVL